MDEKTKRFKVVVEIHELPHTDETKWFSGASVVDEVAVQKIGFDFLREQTRKAANNALSKIEEHLRDQGRL